MGSAQSSQPLSIRESTLSDANIQRDFCIARESIKPEQLPPPVLRHPHKKLVFSIATNEGKNVNRQPIGYTRWRVIPFPPKFGTQACPHFQCEQNVYQYPDAEQTSNTEIHWHVNFADPSLFVAYGGGLFAQDEMQAAEMPALGPVREFLLEKADAARSRPNGNGGEPAIAPHTRASQRPTPILVMNADRRVKIETNRNAAAGRPMGLYGNMFGRAPESAIISATKSLDPPSLVHLVCIAALGGGNGAYTSQQIIDTLANAYTGFLSARIESQAASAPKDNDAGPARPPKRVVIHTGNWGTGAFGGNKELMALLQMIAAWLADVDLVYHTFDAAGTRGYLGGESVLKQILNEFPDGIAVADLIQFIERKNYIWGESDGN